MKTRTQYLNNECSHREYYAQFVSPAIKGRVERSIGMARIANSTDTNLNDIPLAQWDQLTQGFEPFLRGQLKAAGDGFSLAGAVCIFKEAAKQLKETQPS